LTKLDINNAKVIATNVVKIYNENVFTPSLPRVETSLIDTIPEMTDTKIRGNTIILSNIKNREDIVKNI
jgi:hypothetical protein